MASVIAPPQPMPPLWNSKSLRTYDSPGSDGSSSSTFNNDASDRVRIMPTLEDIRAVLNEQRQSHFSDEYQSSEEALSPMLGDDELEEAQDADVEDMDCESEELDELAEHYEPFEVDIATALRVIRVGKPKVVNISPRWVSAQLRASQLPGRSDSLPPSVPSRSGARDRPPRIETRFPNTSAPATDSAESMVISPDSLYTTSLNREASVFSARRVRTDESLTPPTSEHGSGSDSPAFLRSDPFKAQGQAQANAHAEKSRKQGHSRLRSISAKFKKNSDSTKEEPNKLQKKEREVSNTRSSITAIPTSFLDNRSSLESQWSLQDTIPHTAPLPGRSTATLTSPQTPSSAWPPTSSNKPRNLPKMIARGANEREPILHLPPCPKDYDQDIPALAGQPPASIFMTERPARRRPSKNTDVRRRQSVLGLGN